MRHSLFQFLHLISFEVVPFRSFPMMNIGLEGIFLGVLEFQLMLELVLHRKGIVEFGQMYLFWELLLLDGAGGWLSIVKLIEMRCFDLTSND